MASSSNNDREKRPYTKPALSRFPLRPDEAVLGNCKMKTSSGPNVGNNCSRPSPCFALGS